MHKILFICPPYFFDNHLEIFKKYIGFLLSYKYTIVIKNVDGGTDEFRSNSALQVMEAEGEAFVILGNKKYYPLIEPNEKVFFIEPDFGEKEVQDIIVKIIKQTKGIK